MLLHIALIDKVEKRFGVFSELFSGIAGKATDFTGCVKLHTYNKLTHSVSTHRILETYSEEVAHYLGMEEMPAERNLYRALDRIGKHFPVLLERHQNLLKKHKLIDSKQVVDFSSTYLEGNKSDLGMLGYSRDHRPGKLQINFGIATGINGIPSALTIQKGNVQDKEHMKAVLKVVSKVLPKDSMLIFDCGANTKKNKGQIRGLEFHYLTLKARNVDSYKKHIRYFMQNPDGLKHFEVNERHYLCVKKQESDETRYRQEHIFWNFFLKYMFLNISNCIK